MKETFAIIFIIFVFSVTATADIKICSSPKCAKGGDGILVCRTECPNGSIYSWYNVEINNVNGA
jgi:hypothetical protein